MIKNQHAPRIWKRLPLAIAIAAGFSGYASAYTFDSEKLGGVEAQFNTTLSAGATWRTENRDKGLVGLGNGGTASSTNYDDGNLNFDRGDTVSKLVKGNSELFLSYDVDSSVLTRVGALVRGRYWYDFELKDENRQFAPLSSDGSDNASGGEILDAYIFTDWYLGNVPVSARYGNQVVSWGESTFIPGGINTINPIDVNAFRAPGAELKDALLPVEMFYISAGITENVTIEGFVQTDWEKTRIDDCGTFFSTVDFVADGCGPVWLEGDRSDAENANDSSRVLQREGDREADSKDQFGVAMRWYVPSLNNSEIGLYYTQYNSRLPYISGVVNQGTFSRTNPQYFIEYPENIDLYGISINTTTPGGWSLGAEYSFRKDMPIQANAFELITGGLQLTPQAVAVAGGLDPTTAQGNAVFNSLSSDPVSLLAKQRMREAGVTNLSALSGQDVDGYDRYDVSQAQFTLIKFFDQIMGASRMSLINEVGAVYVHGLSGRYGRSGLSGNGPVPLADNLLGWDDLCPVINLNPAYCENEGFTTDFSWGYRTRFVWDYLNAFSGVNLYPRLAWSHDVKGYAPQPGGAFNEGNKSIGFGLEAVYQNKLSADVSYTNYFGGKPYNEFRDRDFISASVSYSF
ncbi:MULTISPECIES: DUF1302 domain-containing protein [unclassified Marinobacter]|uniref:DUF1302 domain-containing protein n=1 Tax=unclassified Marinobacter TaxID=83889 RepID=UPI000BF29D67|nr:MULTISPECIES: DUF1302 domain-containing protein [unclassified Marinobacter]PFG11624.1 uncharacterized protein DUF1302 [Marinobacter sp. LV10MA510-1]PFG53447.1 uncharacterized protein DUF1302 [Marinobacter sp. LV10R520-4]